ncbi:MAG: DNA cytosine methyltransferase [Methanomassiliicoccus sp.]|nr:DNA cytosine methyltransferase [Methanomassiliicoccus sp.]
MAALTVGSLFSGIGGIDLGLERAGMKVSWQCEHDPKSKKPFGEQFNQRILGQHWQGVELYGDVCEIDTDDLERVDIIAGGFPCQDISQAGKGVGISGPRSSLFFEAMRIVRDLRPRFVLLENVPALRYRGLGHVLQELAFCGYDAEWDIVSAASVGALHRRDRMLIVAYPHGGGHLHGEPQEQPAEVWLQSFGEPVPGGQDVSVFSYRPSDSHSYPKWADLWGAEPGVCQVADGVPARVDQLRALGNAVVPQVAEFVGSLIVEAERRVA